ncbi:hypothetical protein MRX96_034826 [Rhipicephalus microplus]
MYMARGRLVPRKERPPHARTHKKRSEQVNAFFGVQAVGPLGENDQSDRRAVKSEDEKLGPPPMASLLTSIMFAA